MNAAVTACIRVATWVLLLDVCLIQSTVIIVKSELRDVFN